MCDYDILVIIDFEATCDEGNQPALRRDEAEIIEFPWVALDVLTRQVVLQRQCYVKPEFTPITTFCTRLTGITSDQLQSAMSLKQALDLFRADMSQFQDRRLCVVTHGSWDLAIQLTREAASKSIPLPPMLRTFFDLKDEYSRWLAYHGDVKNLGTTISGMCESLGLTMNGRLHSGLDDALNIAQITSVLLQDDHRDVFAQPVDLDQELINFYRTRGTIIQLLEIPYRACREDYHDWFATVGVPPPQSLNMVMRDPQCIHPAGNAIAIFATHEQAQAVLRLHSLVMPPSTREVQVRPGTQELVDAALYCLDIPTRIEMGMQMPSVGPAALSTAIEMRPGDWMCRSCGAHNYASRAMCFKCSTGRPADIAPPPPRPQVVAFRPGDWSCPGCNTHNFASRRLCMVCGRLPVWAANQPQGPPQQQQQQQVAAAAGQQQQLQQFQQQQQAQQSTRQYVIQRDSAMLTRDVFASPRDEQLQGSARAVYAPLKPHMTQAVAASQSALLPRQPQAIMFRAGDWLCQRCNEHNFASRQICRKCGITRV
eukprot:TRINITY_DN2559_c0_g3_i1.p1 TRINITY_DN2559_c0_g3~~TRINITY_DN2559_c0_g3_i1.p1  ORF type:complete len:540 (+),score=103.99 TRINITY_DN2559_c0_g3_i1:48-1667(+)